MFKKYACTLQHDQSDCAAAVVSTVLLTYKKELSIMKIREINWNRYVRNDRSRNCFWS